MAAIDPTEVGGYATASMASSGSNPTNMVNAAGAIVSLALIVGVGVWGYKLLVRDVTGIPVVEAIDGPMREAPTDPGGTIANHIGLSVNEVAAEGVAAAAQDTVLLAPREVDLDAGDLVAAIITQDPLAGNTQTTAEAAEPAAELESTVTTALEEEFVPRAPLTAGDVASLVEQITAGAEPLSDLGEGETVAAVASLAAGPETLAISTSIPGVTRSPRPSVRPDKDLRATAVRSAAVNAAAIPVAAVAPQTIPAGTRLVQLGAFDSADIANSEWQRLRVRFADLLGDKTQVVQQAQSGGRTFFRLRAMGFDDLSDARRFCSALAAENAVCIPVVVR